MAKSKKKPATEKKKTVTPAAAPIAQKPIEWTEREVDVKSLRPYERNPRSITVDDFNRLKESITKNGYHQRILVMQDLSVIGGHQRIRALQELGIKKIKVLVPDRELTEEQFKEIMIKDNLPFGVWDFDILASDFEPEQLREWGMPKEWLPTFDAASSDEQGKLDEKEEIESQVIVCPECDHKFSILVKEKTK